MRLATKGAFALLMLPAGTSRAAVAAETETVSGHSSVRPEWEAIRSQHRPWVWEVTKARAKIWLAGGLHMGTARDAAVFSTYLPYYRKASVLYFETLPGSWDTYDVRRLLARRGMLADRQSLSTKLSKNTSLSLTARIASSGGRLSSVLRMEPWLAALTLTRNGYERAGLESVYGLETYLEHLATQDKKALGSLETPKDQILTMADASFADQEVFLSGALAGMESLAATTESLREAWVSGDESRLQSALGINPADARSGMHETLIGTRNQRWVRKIQMIAGQGRPAVVIVGVEHLVAKPDALPYLLEQAGFSVRRVEVER